MPENFLKQFEIMFANLKLGKFLTSFTKKKDQVLPKLEKPTNQIYSIKIQQYKAARRFLTSLLLNIPVVFAISKCKKCSCGRPCSEEVRTSKLRVTKASADGELKTKVSDCFVSLSKVCITKNTKTWVPKGMSQNADKY